MLLPKLLGNDRKNVFPSGQLSRHSFCSSKRIDIWETLETIVQTDFSKLRCASDLLAIMYFFNSACARPSD